MSERPLTSHHIIETASQLFQNAGFDDVSLLQIAEAADVTLEELERVACNKERLVLLLYQELAQDTLAWSHSLSVDSAANHYYDALQYRLAQLEPHSDAMSALFAAALRPRGAVKAADISPGKRDPLLQAFSHLVSISYDKPPKASDADTLVLTLYSLHFLVLLFWFYDRSEQQRATQLLIEFLREFFKMMRPMLVMPLFTTAMHKMAKIMMLVFGGARLVEDNEGTPPKN